jgi:hypothetical protein
VEAVQALPPADQDYIAEAILSLARQDEPEEIDPAHLSDVLESLAQMKRGEFATDEEAAAVFRRLRSTEGSPRG